MNPADAFHLSSNLWVLLAAFAAYLIVVYVGSVFSLQGCMAYFGEELPTYPRVAALKLKLLVTFAAVLLVGYGFLGPLAFLSAPIAFVIALSVVGKAAGCDRFSAAIITLSHTAITTAGAGLCGFLFWVGLTSCGIDMPGVASDVYTITMDGDLSKAYSSDSGQRNHARTRNVSHSNPFVNPSSAPTNASEQSNRVDSDARDSGAGRPAATHQDRANGDQASGEH